MKNKTDKFSVKTLSKRYIISLVVIAALLIAAQVLVQTKVENQIGDSRTINIAGRQRMLSQRLSKLAAQIKLAGNASEAQQYKNELADTINLWEQSHFGLQNGDTELNLSGRNSDEIKTLFLNIDPAFGAMLSSAKSISGELEAGTYSQNIDYNAAVIAGYENQFLAGMNEIVFQYDEEANNNVILVRTILAAAMLTLLVTIIVEAGFVFRPAMKKIGNAMNDLNKFKLAADNTSDHVVITDTEGAIIYANQAAEQITGYSISEMLGKKAGSPELWGGQMDKEFYKRLWHTIEVEKQPFLGEFKNRRKNGKEYYSSASIAPILDARRKIMFYVGIERDITKEKEVDRAKTEFVSLASHQLRTPLSSINWYSEMLLAGDAGKLRKKEKQYINEIYSGNKRMTNLVNDMLDMSRIELGTFSYEPEMLDVVKISKSITKDLKPRIKDKKIKFKEKYTKDIPKTYTDKKIPNMVIDNLVTNAVKYTPEDGTVELNIGFKESGDTFKKKKLENTSIVISVCDSGMGIPKNQQGEVFTKMFRGDNARKSDTDGTGLGLYLAKALIEKEGGEIWFESHESKGTKFFVVLPVRRKKK